MKNLLILVLITISVLSCKKEGCTEPTATNYNEDAKKDDGSCIFPTPAWTSDFTPPSGADLSASDLESPAYFRMMKATSTNGVDWTANGTIITDQGNVPDMVLKNDSIFLYYTGWNVGTIQNRTVLAVSGDQGVTWVFKHISLLGYGSGELVNNGDPDVILLEDGTIRMFITTVHNTKKSVLCYESSDGINFIYVDVATHSSSNDMFDSNTFFFNGGWHQLTISGVGTTHFHSTSADGVHFTSDGSLTFNNGAGDHFASNGFVDGTNYRLFTSFLPDQDLFSFLSTNGASWTPEPGIRLNFGTVAGEGSYLKDPAVVKLANGTYFMVYVTRIP